MPPSTVTDFSTDDAWHDVAYQNAAPAALLRLKRWLRDNPEATVRMYHGTAAKHPIEEEGIKRTTGRRRNSFQSGSGFSYLSIFPGHSKNFASMAYPGQPLAVYVVEVPVRMLVADKDQLKNKRYWGERADIGSTLADSIAYGFGARVKGDIPPWAIKGRWEESTKRKDVSASDYLPAKETPSNSPEQSLSAAY